jgi:hypothetical protein
VHVDCTSFWKQPALKRGKTSRRISLRLQIAAIAALALAASCAGDRGGSDVKNTASAMVATETAEPSQETYALGSTVSASGAVPKEASGETFIQGGPVFLSINVDGASIDHQVEVQWVAPNGRALRHEERLVPRSADFVAFTTGSTDDWPVGQHRAIVVIDGRKVTEKRFVLTTA